MRPPAGITAQPPVAIGRGQHQRALGLSVAVGAPLDLEPNRQIGAGLYGSRQTPTRIGHRTERHPDGLEAEHRTIAEKPSFHVYLTGGLPTHGRAGLAPPPGRQVIVGVAEKREFGCRVIAGLEAKTLAGDPRAIGRYLALIDGRDRRATRWAGRAAEPEQVVALQRLEQPQRAEGIPIDRFRDTPLEPPAAINLGFDARLRVAQDQRAPVVAIKPEAAHLVVAPHARPIVTPVELEVGGEQIEIIIGSGPKFVAPEIGTKSCAHVGP